MGSHESTESTESTESNITRLLERIKILEQRLNNQVKGRLKCDVQESSFIFFELNLKKRIPDYLKKSCALTNQVTDQDIRTMIQLIKSTLFNVLDQFDVQVTVFHLEVCNVFDMRVRVSGVSTRIISGHTKSDLYEEIERKIKTTFGEIIFQVPFAENMYDPYQLHLEKRLRLKIN